jgi:MFS family permease
MVDQYKSLYLDHLGLGAGEIGLYNALAQGVLLVSALLGGYLADAWGRRLTINVFDVLSWAIPALLLALAPNKWFGVAAILFFGFNSGANIAYICLLVEKNPPRRRADVYTVLQTVNQVPSLVFLPLLAGWWVERAGLEDAARGMYALFFVLVSVGIWSRYRYLEDDRPRKAPKGPPWGEKVLREAREYASAMGEYFSRRGSVPMFFSRLIDEWMMAFWLLYVPLYMVRHLGLAEGDFARVNQYAVFLSFLSLLLVIPAIHKLRGYRMLGAEQVLAAVAVLALLLGREHPVFWVCFLSQGLGALAGTFFWSFTASAWAHLLEGPRRARMLAGSYALMRVGLLVAGFPAAFLYDRVSPEAFLVLVLVLRFVNAALLRRVSSVLSPMIEKEGKVEWRTRRSAGSGRRSVTA